MLYVILVAERKDGLSEFDLKDEGAKGPGIEVDTKCLQLALDE